MLGARGVTAEPPACAVVHGTGPARGCRRAGKRPLLGRRGLGPEAEPRWCHACHWLGLERVLEGSLVVLRQREAVIMGSPDGAKLAGVTMAPAGTRSSGGQVQADQPRPGDLPYRGAGGIRADGGEARRSVSTRLPRPACPSAGILEPAPTPLPAPWGGPVVCSAVKCSPGSDDTDPCDKCHSFFSSAIVPGRRGALFYFGREVVALVQWRIPGEGARHTSGPGGKARAGP